LDQLFDTKKIERGLHYNYHRYYDPKLGRYLRADPIGLDGGINIYTYVDDPISWIEPEGLEEEHTSGARPSTEGQHQKGKRRKKMDRGGEKGDEARRPPRKRPDNWKGPWPPQDETPKCGETCKKVIKAVQDTATGILYFITIVVCSQTGATS
jgi:RHS repeat-associated protein